jgi:hypothetical protein
MDIDLESFLNSLAEAERAGGRVLHELTEQAQSLELREMLRKVTHDEGSPFSRASSNSSIAASAGWCERSASRLPLWRTNVSRRF